MPGDVAVFGDEDDTVIDGSVRCLGDDAWWGAGAAYEGEGTDALGVVGADNGMGGEIVWSSAELPDDLSSGACFDDAVVELVGDQDVAWLIEMRGGCSNSS